MTLGGMARGLVRPGLRAGALEIVARLGAGGQGEVWLARPWAEAPAPHWASRSLLRAQLRAGALTTEAAASHRMAALKVAYPAMADSLHDEHAHLAVPGAAHPHLPCLYSGRFPGAPQPDLGLLRAGEGLHPLLYLALAYEAGAPLSRLLARRGRPPVGWSVAVAAQVTRAIAHLHGRGVVHHDVRPANVLVRRGPTAVLVDLGAAEVVGAPRRRAVYGAPGWLAPERLGSSPAPASPLVDIYGVGALLAALTAGAAPPPLARLIGEATEPDPQRRGAALPSSEALLARLEALLAVG